MTDRPIPFSAPMVRAILEGRKTQTRRVLKGAWQSALEGHDRVKTWFAPSDIPREGIPNQWAQSGIWAEKHGPRGYNRFLGYAPYRPGDRLWAREAWRTISAFDDTRPRELPRHAPIFYEIERPENADYGRLRPGMFMPRWASRITLIVESVRVERLQDISEADARAEGPTWAEGPYFPNGVPEHTVPPGWRARFAHLWDSINGTRRWEANPWVAAITFRAILANIDSPETAQ